MGHKLAIVIMTAHQSTANAPPNRPMDSTAGIIKSRSSKRKIAPFGLEVAPVEVVGLPVESGLGTGVDGLYVTPLAVAATWKNATTAEFVEVDKHEIRIPSILCSTSLHL